MMRFFPVQFTFNIFRNLEKVFNSEGVFLLTFPLLHFAISLIKLKANITTALYFAQVNQSFISMKSFLHNIFLSFQI